MSYEDFEDEVNILVNLEQAATFLNWDEEVMMPENGVKPRSKQKSTLSKVRHEKLTSNRLDELIESVDEDSLNHNQQANLREIKREREKMLEVPGELVEKISQKESECVDVWKKAKEKDDFKMFAEELRELVKLKREYAAALNEDKEPYKALYQDYEPYLGFERMESILQELKENLNPMIDRIKDSDAELTTDAFKGDFDEDKEMEVNKEIVKEMGFPESKGRVDLSAHPFTLGNSFDTRITTRIIEGDLTGSIMPTIHEGGHALYNLGVPEKYYGTPRGQPRELSIHESQSRLWENQLGRSKEFWKHTLPKLKDRFPEEFEETTIEDCYESVNQVYDDNLTRVEADELTYHMHIIIRFEIGRKLINGEIEVENLPEIWDEKMNEYLGITPETDAEGVMQDIHWAWGSFGYFPTYTLGSVISAQLYNKLEEEVEQPEEKIENGEFEPILEWLRENIHQKGRLLKTEELVEEATGEKPNAGPFLNYIEEKYSKLYNL